MNYYYQRFLLVLGSFAAAGIICFSFYAKLATKEPKRLPLGLTLEQRGGQLVVTAATQSSREYGIRRGDVILCVDDVAVSSQDRFREALAEKKSGDRISIGVSRNGKTVTINNRFHGDIEATSAKKEGTSFAQAPSKRRSLSARKTQLQQQVAQDALTPSSLGTPNSAAFGLLLQEKEGKLVVVKVDRSAAGGAYGVQVSDVLFQIDETRTDTFKDYLRVAEGKTAGDTANLMLIRGDSIVLLPEVVLGGIGQHVAAPEDYAPVVKDLASFTQESLAELLEAPFKQFFSPVPKAPGNIGALSMPAAPRLEEIAKESLDGELLGNPGERIEADFAKVAQQDVSSPVLPIFDQQFDAEPPASAADPRTTRFSDVADEIATESTGDTAAVASSPNTVPRFHKYSTMRLPEPPPSIEAAAMDWATIESSLVQGTGVPSRYDSDKVATQNATNPAGSGGNGRRSTDRALLDSEAWPVADSAAEVEPKAELRQSADLLQSSPYGTRPVARNRQVQPELPSPSDEQLQSADEVDQAATEQQAFANSVNEATSNYGRTDRAFPRRPSPYPPSYSMCTECGAKNCTDCDSPGGSGMSRMLNGKRQSGFTVGGWLAVGYHSQSDDLFNDRPDKVALHQGWLYLEREATPDRPFGFRADVMYGIDGADTQAFGNELGTWDFDNGFDFGAYAWAVPQLYAEVAIGDWNIMAGHFFTKIGYEAVAATENFFYSHSMTMYNSEPFTHTGILAERSVGEKAAVFAGWTLGWDTGFDQFNGGSSWLGGFGYEIHDDVKFTFMSTAGNLGARGDEAYSHSIVFETEVTDRLMWVAQSDYLRIDSTGEDNIGLNQYLFYAVNDKVDVGARVEWWKGDALNGYAPHGGVLPASGSLSYYEATFGLNYRPHDNIRVRPEVRVDWSPVANYEETYFGVDAILNY